MTEPSNPIFITQAELAKRWRCTTFTLSRRWRSVGLKPFRMGRENLFRLEQVQAVERRETSWPRHATPPSRSC